MKKRIFGIASLLLLSLLTPLTVSAEALPGQVNLAGQSLALNGQGVRTKWFMKLYRAGLYLPAKSADATTILAPKSVVAMRLKITSGLITSEKMEQAVREGFQASAGDQAEALKPRIDQLIQTFKQPIKEGDVYDFVYTPGRTMVLKNGQQGTVVGGHDFKQALFGIWLGPKAVDPKLSKALLGG